MSRDRGTGLFAAVLGLLGLVMLGLSYYAAHGLPGIQAVGP